MTWPQWLLAVFIIFVCCLLMLVILLQRGRGGGLAGAFGGAGGSSAFGAKTGDVLTWITVAVAVGFLCVAVVANFVFDQSPTPVTAAAPASSSGTAPPATDTGRVTIPVAPEESTTPQNVNPENGSGKTDESSPDSASAGKADAAIPKDQTQTGQAPQTTPLPQPVPDKKSQKEPEQKGSPDGGRDEN